MSLDTLIFFYSFKTNFQFTFTLVFCTIINQHLNKLITFLWSNNEIN
jgi:hypothetical protein